MDIQQTKNNVTTYGQQMRDEARTAMGTAMERTEGYVDTATSAVGRTLETAADKALARSQTALDGVARAGRYLQESDARALGRDITEIVRRNPTTSLLVGFGIGIVVGRAIAR